MFLKQKDYVNKLPKNKKSIKGILNELNNFVDPSDPDVNEDNIYHAYETAEMIRKDYPLDYPLDLELQITGLIHDLGKRIYTFHYFYDKPWSVVGDIYPVGCKFSNKIICSKFLKVIRMFLMNIIRFHSFYAWHTDGEYKYFENDKDKTLLKNIKKFNKYDLYSKNEKIEITDKVKKYYDVLLNYYFPENLLW